MIRAIEDGMLILLLSSMILISITQILLRNFFDFGFSWADPLLRILVLWVGLAGAIVATRENNHISINILSRYLSARMKIVMRIVVDVFTASVCMVVAYHAARFVLMERSFGAIAFASVPTWICELILPLAFGIIALRYFTSFLIHLRAVITGATPR